MVPNETRHRQTMQWIILLVGLGTVVWLAVVREEISPTEASLVVALVTLAMGGQIKWNIGKSNDDQHKVAQDHESYSEMVERNSKAPRDPPNLDRLDLDLGRWRRCPAVAD